MTGSATLTTVLSRNAMLEPRIAASSAQRGSSTRVGPARLAAMLGLADERQLRAALAGLGRRAVPDRELAGDVGGDAREDLCDLRLGVAHDDRRPLVAGAAHGRLERDVAQVPQPGALGQLAAAAAQEDLLVVAAARADEPAHVLDQAQHR